MTLTIVSYSITGINVCDGRLIAKRPPPKTERFFDMLFSCAPRATAKRAFTLIELLVVIAIIAILAAILFPVFAQAREKARQTACLSNTKQMCNALQMYAQDYDETIFTYRYSASTITDGLAEGYPTYHFFNQILDPYIKSYNVWICPSNPIGWVNQNGGIDKFNGDGYGGQNSYGVNKYVFQPDTVDKNNPFQVGLPLSAMPKPADTIVMLDTTYYNTMPRSPRGGPTLDDSQIGPGKSYWSYWTNIGNSINNYSGSTIAAGSPEEAQVYRAGKSRHSGFINVVWADGHSKAVEYVKLVNDMTNKVTAEGNNSENILWDPWKKGVCTNGTGSCD